MNLVCYPEPKLVQPCSPVNQFGEELAKIASEMMDVMYRERGVGLAAPQVGLPLNMLLVDPSGGEKDDQLLVLVNPQILWKSERQVVLQEGCLSIPGVFLKVSRPAEVEVEYQDVEGNVRRLKVGDWASRIIQHEHDHLVGTLMLDRVNRHDRRVCLKNLKKKPNYTEEHV